ncbi:MAG: D-alanyl-D-alanine carboxypeptidase/D-alanyl-D-alanine-endopeptidase [Pseudomonadota bacterium]
MIWILSLFLLTVNSLIAAPWKSDPQKLILQEIKKTGIPKEKFGLWVQKADQIVGVNENQQLVPASLSKIPTALAFLKNRSMDETFKTWIYKTGKIKKGVLEGDLYLKGGGDPTLVNESMWLMIRELKRSGIQKITGNIYVDESYFDSDYYSRGRQNVRVDRAYDAPVSALSLNWNSLTIFIRPGDRVGGPAKVFLDPSLSDVEIQNRSKTMAGTRRTVTVKRLSKDGRTVIRVEGSFGIHAKEKAFYKSIEDASLWTGKTFKKILNESGVEAKGSVSLSSVPKNATQLVEFDSWEIPRVMSALSKFSNNFVAEMLTKHIGKKQGAPATMEDGLKAINTFLAEKGWKASEYNFVNPSGFTRKNKMRADRLGELLSQSYEQFSLAPEFLSSLPISGIDGTLEKRMKKVMRAKVRAKTGYLNGVVGLAGYMESRSGGEPIVFVFMYNGSPQLYDIDWKVRALFDRILWKLFQIS